jgi:hypothetical protein
LGVGLSFLIGFPIGASVLATLLSASGIVSLAVISISAIALAVIAAGISQYLSGASIGFLTFNIQLPEITGWWLRFIFASTFLVTFYSANLLAAFSIFASMPMYLGIVLPAILSGMFIFGVFDFASGDSGGSK